MYISPDNILVSVIAIFIGLFICLFSIRAIKVVLFSVGFVVGYIGCQTLFNNIDLGATPNKETIYDLSTFISGIILGFIVLRVLHAGLFILGSVGGFFTAKWILNFLPSDSEFHNSPYSSLLIGFFVLFFCVITHFYKMWVLIICSSIIGSCITFYGIDRIANLGYLDASELLLDEGSGYVVSNSLLVMLSCNLLLAIIGFSVQSYTYIKMKKEKQQQKELEQIEEEEELL